MVVALVPVGMAAQVGAHRLRRPVILRADGLFLGRTSLRLFLLVGDEFDRYAATGLVNFAFAALRGSFIKRCGLGRRLIARGSTRSGRSPT